MNDCRKDVNSRIQLNWSKTNFTRAHKHTFQLRRRCWWFNYRKWIVFELGEQAMSGDIDEAISIMMKSRVLALSNDIFRIRLSAPHIFSQTETEILNICSYKLRASILSDDFSRVKCVKWLQMKTALILNNNLYGGKLTKLFNKFLSIVKWCLRRRFNMTQMEDLRSLLCYEFLLMHFKWCDHDAVVFVWLSRISSWWKTKDAYWWPNEQKLSFEFQPRSKRSNGEEKRKKKKKRLRVAKNRMASNEICKNSQRQKEIMCGVDVKRPKAITDQSRRLPSLNMPRRLLHDVYLLCALRRYCSLSLFLSFVPFSCLLVDVIIYKLKQCAKGVTWSSDANRKDNKATIFSINTKRCFTYSINQLVTIQRISANISWRFFWF